MTGFAAGLNDFDGQLLAGDDRRAQGRGGRVSEPEFPSQVFVLPVQLRWGECDPAGIIFYPTYFQWFDAATWNMFAQVGFDAKRMRAEHRAMPLVAAPATWS